MANTKKTRLIIPHETDNTNHVLSLETFFDQRCQNVSRSFHYEHLFSRHRGFLPFYTSDDQVPPVHSTKSNKVWTQVVGFLCFCVIVHMTSCKFELLKSVRSSSFDIRCSDCSMYICGLDRIGVILLGMTGVQTDFISNSISIGTTDCTGIRLLRPRMYSN